MRRNNLQRLRDDVERAVVRSGLDANVKAALSDEMREADRLAYIVLSRDGYLDYFSKFLSREHTKYTNSDPLQDTLDGERLQPLCLCSDRYCPLKQGRLPRQIRTAKNPKQALRTFADDHPGEPLVIHDFKDEYREEVVAFGDVHRRVLTCAQHGIHPDDLEEQAATDETADQAVADD